MGHAGQEYIAQKQNKLAGFERFLGLDTIQRLRLVHPPCHGRNRGIQRGTLAQNLSYSSPKVRRKVGSS